jgi:hypothetical protein
MTSPDKREYRVTEERVLRKKDWDRGQAPRYRTDECAKFFFSMSASWLRLLLTPDEDHPETWFVDATGRRIQFRRADENNPQSARIFLISDIEPMAYSLFDFGRISAQQLSRILNVVLAEADLYELFDKSRDQEPEPEPEPEQPDD